MQPAALPHLLQQVLQLAAASPDLSQMNAADCSWEHLYWIGPEINASGAIAKCFYHQTAIRMIQQQDGLRVGMDGPQLPQNFQASAGAFLKHSADQGNIRFVFPHRRHCSSRIYGQAYHPDMEFRFGEQFFQKSAVHRRPLCDVQRDGGCSLFGFLPHLSLPIASIGGQSVPRG